MRGAMRNEKSRDKILMCVCVYDTISFALHSTNSPIDEKMHKAAGKKDAGGKDDTARDINLFRSLLQDNGEPRADDGEDRKDGHGKTLPGVERERHVGSVSEKESACTDPK